MENNSLISIIIPVYNVEKHLKKCVDSVLVQSYNNIEVILIDDGSTDKSGNICDKLALSDSRIVVKHKKNGGLSSARNMGIDEAKGEYITFIDSDDVISEDYIEYLYKNLIDNDSDISIGNICVSYFEKRERNSKEDKIVIYNKSYKKK